MKTIRFVLVLSTALILVLQVPLSVGDRGITASTEAQSGTRGQDLPSPSGVTVNPWPMQRYNETHSGMSPSTAPNTNAILWQSPTGPNTWSSPAIADGKVFIGAQTATGDFMFAFYQDNGTLAWKTKTQNPASGGNGLTSSPAYANGLVFFGSDAFYALYANNGTIKWRYTTGNLNWGDGSPTVYQNMLFIPGSDRKLYRMDQQSGARIWTFQTGAGGNNNFGLYSAPAIWNNFVYLAACDGFVYQLNVNQTGPVATALHTFNTGITGQENAMYGSPVVYDGKVIIGDGYYTNGLNTNRLFALNAMDISLAPVWQFNPGRATSFFGSAAAGYNTIFTGSIEGYLYAISPVNGAKIWEYNIGNTWSSPAIADNKVFIGSKGGTFYAFDVIQPVTPVTKWTYPTGGDVSSAPAVADNRVCVGSNGGGGKVICFGTQVAPPDNPPSVTAFEPGGTAGQSFTAGTQVQVRWKAADDNPMPASNINISYGSGASWTRIISNTLNDGTQMWDTTPVPAGNYYINISAFDSRGQSSWDLGNFTFQITIVPDNPPSVTAWEPGGTSGQAYTVGQSVQVRWTATDDHAMPPSNVNISYGSGVAWNNVIRNTANSGSYPWDTTGVAPGTYYINVSAYDSKGQSDWDLGNFTFSINPPPNEPPTVSVIQPAGGEVWSGGTPITIVWDMSDSKTPQSALLVYLNYSSSVGGAPIAGPLTGLSPPFTHLWNLPYIDAIDVTVLIDVIDSDGGKGSNSSHPFGVDSTHPIVILTSPANGEMGVPMNTNVRVDWSEGMNRTATGPAFTLYDNITWSPVGGSTSWIGNSLVFDSALDLNANSWYTANITTAAKDGSNPGNQLFAPYSFSFRTAAISDNIPPQITDVRATPSPQEVHSSVNISAVVTDDFAVGTVVVNVSGATNVSMSFDGASGRYFYMHTYDALGTHPFTIFAADTSYNWNSSSGSFVIRDTTPPVIQHTPVTSALTGDTINITATVTDNFLLQSLKLNFTDVDSAISNLSMTPAGADRFYHVIAAQPHFGTLTYFVWAVDSSGNPARTQAYSVAVSDKRPNPPIDLTVTPQGFGTLRLSWTAPSTNVGGSPLSDLVGFNIYRMEQPTGSRVKVNSAPWPNSTYTDTGLQDGKTYYFIVMAVNSLSLESAESNTASGTTPSRTPTSDNVPILIGVAIIIVIVVMVLIAIMMRKRKKDKSEPGEQVETGERSEKKQAG